MRKHTRFFLRCAAFVCAACVCIHMVYQIIVPKYFSDDMWPTTSAYLGFYEMEENTIDVLFFGSSHAASAFAPQELYNEYGITSYNLGCEQQNLITSYYWLKEALRYQKPKVVLLDCYMLFSYDKKEPLNTQESRTRKAFDYMKWSPVKREAVKTICELDPKQSLMGYYFPNIRYHTRWKELLPNDFSFASRSKHNELKGYAPQALRSYREDFVPIEAGTADAQEEMIPLMREYLEKIRELCEQEGISLLLVKTPTVLENMERFNTTRAYAEEHGLPFYDFNEKELYEKAGFIFSEDNKDDEHANFWGAQKITNYMGRVLTEDYGVAGRTDEQWECTKAYYEEMKSECALAGINDIDEYLEALQSKNYSILLSTKGDWAVCLRDSTVQKLRNLGLQEEIQKTPDYNYAAVISDGKVMEKGGEDDLFLSGTFEQSHVMYEIMSSKITSSVKLDNMEKVNNVRGLNIVVYDQEIERQVDAVCFHTFEENNTANR